VLAKHKPSSIHPSIQRAVGKAVFVNSPPKAAGKAIFVCASKAALRVNSFPSRPKAELKANMDIAKGRGKGRVAVAKPAPLVNPVVVAANAIPTKARPSARGPRPSRNSKPSQ
jgi:hypothetical protein